MGHPGDVFPRPWSIYGWIEGHPASLEPVADLPGFAADLARFLVALYAVDASDGPPPGWHNFFRGASLRTFVAEMKKKRSDVDAGRSIELLADEIDADAAAQVWEAASPACGVGRRCGFMATWWHRICSSSTAASEL